MASINKMQVGQALYSVHRFGVAKRVGHYVVTILEINLVKNQVFASVNANPPRWWGEHIFKKWKANKPKSI